MPPVRSTPDEQAAQRFHTHLRPLLAQNHDTELFPSWLAVAVQRALVSDGAGLSIIDERHRVPIGASSAEASAVERLQFTLGVGPCLRALTTARGVRVDEEEMRGEWPPFHAELIDRSSYRSIVAVPIVMQSGLRGALDVYFDSPSMPAYAVVNDALAVAAEVAHLLDAVDGPDDDTGDAMDSGLPAWGYGPQARRRLRIWLAVGMVVADLAVSTESALSTLRAYAYARDLNIESVTVDLVSGALQVGALSEI